MSDLAMTKLPGFAEHVAEGAHNFGTASLVLALSNTAPNSETTPPDSSTAACVLGNVTQIAYTNLSSRALTCTTTTFGSTLFLLPENVTLTASGSVPAFRYAYVVNTSSVSPSNALVGYYDLGTSIALANTDTVSFAFDPEEGLLSIGENIASYTLYYSSWYRQNYSWDSFVAIDWWAD